MKKHKKIFFGIIFFLTTFLSIGLNAYSNYCIEPYNIEQSTGSDQTENRILIDADSFDDDQINSTSKLLPITYLCYFLQISPVHFLIHRSSSSVWQPPK